jgi:beta-lactamase class A
MPALVEHLNSICDDQPYDVRWYLRNVRSGETADREGDVPIASASIRKIAIMMAMFRAVKQGRFSLEQPVPIKSEFQRGNFIGSIFQYFTPGYSVPLKDHIILMIIVSDNVCTGTIVDMLGLDEVNDFCQAIGMARTVNRFGFVPEEIYGNDRNLLPETTNVTTANDQGLLLDLMLKGTRDTQVASRLGCTPALCQFGLDILSWQKYSSGLPSLLPENTKVAHKTGTIVQDFDERGRPISVGYHDAGIIFYREEPLFILTVFTQGVPREFPDGTPNFHHAARVIGRICRACWDRLKE